MTSRLWRRDHEHWNPEYLPYGTEAQRGLPVDALATQTHYLDHLAPVWTRLADCGRAGALFIPRALEGYAKKMRIPRLAAIDPDRVPNDGPIMVASNDDLERVVRCGSPRPLILFEHGVGFSFSDENPYYAGGRSAARAKVGLFVCPNEYAARRNSETYPGASVAIVGCPKMDRWKPGPRRGNNGPVVAFSFHWDCPIAPETKSAWGHYHDALDKVAWEWKTLGHGHPKMMHRLAPWYQRAGVDVAYHFDEVLAGADVYVCDASSTIYEFASLDRPVVVLNAPWYRRGVHHGLRFWEHSDVGVVCDNPQDLLCAIRAALEDSQEQQEKRRKAVEAAFPVRGDATGHAARAVLGWLAQHKSRCGYVEAGQALEVISASPGTYGALYVAFGRAAREECERSIAGLRTLYPDMPVAVVSDRMLEAADQTILQPDTEATAREYKTRAVEFAPWEYTLFLDADTRIVGDLQGGFTALAAGWDMAAAVDYRPTLADVDHIWGESLNATIAEVGTPHALHYNSGVLFFRKSRETMAFYKLWHKEWRRWAFRDQAAFLRALHKSKLKLWTLGPQWNTHVKEDAKHVWHIHHVAAREGAPL